MRKFPDFIEAYLKFTSHHEGSRRIHLWSCLSIIAGSIERKVYLERGYYRLFPNLYVFIVGPSGLVKKSTSTGIALSLLRALDDIKIMSDRVTAGSLIDQFSNSKKLFYDQNEEIEQASMFIYASELIVFVKEVFGSVTELLTTFWDCPEIWHYKTKNSGQVKLHNVTLNMLAATTIQWLREGITQQVMSAGFAGRVLFVCQKKTEGNWVAWPEPPKNHLETKEFLIQDLQRIHELVGEMKVSDESKLWFKNWYENHMNTITETNKDPRMNGYLGRKGEILLKIAVIRSISLSDSLTLEIKHLEWAAFELNEIEKDLDEVYSPVGSSERGDLDEKLFEYIRCHNSVGEKKLIAKFEKLMGFTRVQRIRALQNLLSTNRIMLVSGTISDQGIYAVSHEAHQSLRILRSDTILPAEEKI